MITEVIAKIEANGASTIPSLVQDLIELSCNRAEAAG
jgi:hypothetical protein